MKKIFILLFVIALTACQSKPGKTDGNLSASHDTIQTVLHVERMTCDHCEMTIEGSVKELAGIVEVKADHEDSTTLVKYDAAVVTLADISAAIEKKGYKVIAEK
ncbi:MAG: cation transporter [Prolixibacteraceae bacterium]